MKAPHGLACIGESVCVCGVCTHFFVNFRRREGGSVCVCVREREAGKWVLIPAIFLVGALSLFLEIQNLFFKS